ncbi:MAG: hypothetical protein CMK36_01825 [Porticoccaceae bacterium]|nr:hypothetical protein [Porticoccaceae bacterium]|tara:strand:+ start:5984 stop:6250 length:267 start_codon:yes stop_codon:yes gene_type:complete
MSEAAIKKWYWITHAAIAKDLELHQKCFEAASYLERRGDFKMVCGRPLKATHEGHLMKFGAVLEFSTEGKAKTYYKIDDYQAVALQIR